MSYKKNDDTADLADKYRNLVKSLNYSFTDYSFLQLALTHRSYAVVHNERLEFLGDSILGMVIADQLYKQFPNVQEGDLTRMRSTLVRETTLAEIARDFKLSDYLRMGPGEMKSGGYRRDSVLADAVESILGAIYLDSGRNFEVVRAVLLGWFTSRLETIHPGTDQKDPKSRLQELMQAKHMPLPHYTVVEVSGEEHDLHFEVKLELENLGLHFLGRGSSRRHAEQEAAEKALEQLQEKMK